MRKGLSAEMLSALRRLVSKRRPGLVPAVDQIESGFLASQYKELLIEVLTEEFLAVGLKEDGEPNGYGLVLEDIIDRVNGMQ